MILPRSGVYLKVRNTPCIINILVLSSALAMLYFLPDVSSNDLSSKSFHHCSGDSRRLVRQSAAILFLTRIRSISMRPFWHASACDNNLVFHITRSHFWKLFYCSYVAVTGLPGRIIDRVEKEACLMSKLLLTLFVSPQNRKTTMLLLWCDLPGIACTKVMSLPRSWKYRLVQIQLNYPWGLDFIRGQWLYVLYLSGQAPSYLGFFIFGLVVVWVSSCFALLFFFWMAKRREFSAAREVDFSYLATQVRTNEPKKGCTKNS